MAVGHAGHGGHGCACPFMTRVVRVVRVPPIWVVTRLKQSTVVHPFPTARENEPPPKKRAGEANIDHLSKRKVSPSLVGGQTGRSAIGPARGYVESDRIGSGPHPVQHALTPAPALMQDSGLNTL